MLTFNSLNERAEAVAKVAVRLAALDGWTVSFDFMLQRFRSTEIDSRSREYKYLYNAATIIETLEDS